jgi:hypothetical protein
VITYQLLDSASKSQIVFSAMFFNFKMCNVLPDGTDGVKVTTTVFCLLIFKQEMTFNQGGFTVKLV